ncbi:hypothetical protein SH1V18_39070 [Vallitalea longa]|uniref:Uncharacterized protein n=1 Tax=Vallitalea longa TaxID=2936439 RepID=A0A9W6DHC7_9FIRM|nr:hypothetical protein SH1V18_39070 [Vallitalea longa]
MYKLLKSNLIYTLQNKIYLIIQVLMLVYIDVFSVIYIFKYNNSNTDYSHLPNIPIIIFLFISTFIFISNPFMSPKQYSTNDYSIFTLSFPITKKQYVISHYIKLLIYMILILIDIFLVSLITMLISRIPITYNYFLLLFFIVLYTVGITGSFYIMIFFITKYYKIISLVFYFTCFFIYTIINVNKIFSSEYINIILLAGISFIPISCLISLFMVKLRDFN